MTRELGVGLSIEEDTQHVIWPIREGSASVGKQEDQPEIQVNLDFRCQKKNKEQKNCLICLLFNLSKQIFILWLQCSMYYSKFFTSVILLNLK